ncbi:MAG: GIY-YIG nuclease family protein [Bacteroidales bacterium]
MYFVYIIESLLNGRYYIGQTKDLRERIERHNKGRNLSTKAYLPWELKWWKEFETRADAIKTETTLKGIKKREGIISFVNKHNFRGVAQPG